MLNSLKKNHDTYIRNLLTLAALAFVIVIVLVPEINRMQEYNENGYFYTGITLVSTEDFITYLNLEGEGSESRYGVEALNVENSQVRMRYAFPSLVFYPELQQEPLEEHQKPVWVLWFTLVMLTLLGLLICGRVFPPATNTTEQTKPGETDNA